MTHAQLPQLEELAQRLHRQRRSVDACAVYAAVQEIATRRMDDAVQHAVWLRVRKLIGCPEGVDVVEFLEKKEEKGAMRKKWRTSSPSRP
jgi:hypothetical protein